MHQVDEAALRRMSQQQLSRVKMNWQFNRLTPMAAERLALFFSFTPRRCAIWMNVSFFFCACHDACTLFLPRPMSQSEERAAENKMIEESARGSTEVHFPEKKHWHLQSPVSGLVVRSFSNPHPRTGLGVEVCRVMLRCSRPPLCLCCLGRQGGGRRGGAGSGGGPGCLQAQPPRQGVDSREKGAPR